MENFLKNLSQKSHHNQNINSPPNLIETEFKILSKPSDQSKITQRAKLYRKTQSSTKDPKVYKGIKDLTNVPPQGHPKKLRSSPKTRRSPSPHKGGPNGIPKKFNRRRESLSKFIAK